MIGRRRFIKNGSALASAFLSLKGVVKKANAVGHTSPSGKGYGPLRRDPNKILDLPLGFTHKVISTRGDVMSDGLVVPGKHDGMGAFPSDDGRVILVRNHELNPKDARHSANEGFYGAWYGKGADRLVLREKNHCGDAEWDGVDAELIRDHLPAKVDQAQADQHGQERRIDRPRHHCVRSHSRFFWHEEAEEKKSQEAHQKLDGRIQRGDSRFARPALGSKKHPGDQGNVVPRTNGLQTARARRTR